MENEFKAKNHLILLIILFTILAIVLPALGLSARERGEYDRTHDRNHRATPSYEEPIIIPEEILKEWKEDLEEGNYEKVLEEYNNILENGLPEEEASDEETGGSENEDTTEIEEEQQTDRRVHTRSITHDRGEGAQGGEVNEPADTPEEEVAPEEEGDSGSTYVELVVLEIHRLTNIERKKLGLEPFEMDPILKNIAEVHSGYMAENNYFSHRTLEGCDLKCRLDEENYEASMWGENIAWRSDSSLPSPEEMALTFVRGWINSSGHAHNMLSSEFVHTGVGVAERGDVVFATVDFTRP